MVVFRGSKSRPWCEIVMVLVMCKAVCSVPVCQPDTQLPCTNNVDCYLRSQRCDGLQHCVDGSDEKGRSNVNVQSRKKDLDPSNAAWKTVLFTFFLAQKRSHITCRACTDLTRFSGNVCQSEDKQTCAKVMLLHTLKPDFQLFSFQTVILRVSPAWSRVWCSVSLRMRVWPRGMNATSGVPFPLLTVVSPRDSVSPTNNGQPSSVLYPSKNRSNTQFCLTFPQWTSFGQTPIASHLFVSRRHQTKTVNIF